MISVFGHILKIAGNVRIHVIMPFLRLLFLLFNDVVIILNYFLLFWDWGFDLFLKVGLCLSFFRFLTNGDLIIILLWRDFAIIGISLLDFLKSVIVESFFESFDDFFFLSQMWSGFFLFDNQRFKSIFDHVFGSLAIEGLDDFGPFPVLRIRKFEEFEILFFAPAATKE